MASAITKEELPQEALIERINSHGKRNFTKKKAGKFKFAIAWYYYNNLTDPGRAVTIQLGSGDGQRNSQITGTNVNTTNMQLFDFMADWSSPLGSEYGDRTLIRLDNCKLLHFTGLFSKVRFFML